MRPGQLSFAVLAVALSSLVAGSMATATVYTEVSDARKYTAEWSTDAYNTTAQACWDFNWSCQDYLSSFSDVNIFYCEIENPNTTIHVYCGGNTIASPNVYNDFTQNVMRMWQARLIAGPQDYTPQTPPGWTPSTSTTTKATTTTKPASKPSPTLTPKQIAKQKADAARHRMHARLQRLADQRRAALKAAKAKAKAIARKALLSKQNAVKALRLAKKKALQAKRRAALAKAAARKKRLAQVAAAKKKAAAKKALKKAAAVKRVTKKVAPRRLEQMD